MNEWLWFLTRAAGLVSLVLLTGSLVLGIATSGRLASPRLPAFVRTSLHRTLSLLTVVFLAGHVVTSVVETYVDIGWLSVLVPFTSAYDRFWVGLGTLAFDLLLAITVTSLLRSRISTRWWRLVHWTAYALWPIALAHGIGASTEDGPLVLAVAGGCAVAVVAALVWRLRTVNLDAGRRQLAPARAWR